MIYLGNNLKITFTISNINYNGVTANTLFDKLNTYSKEDILYSIEILYQCNYIVGDCLTLDKYHPGKVKICSITYEGQMFLESIKSQTVWSKTKTILEKIGVHSLRFVETVAHDVAVEMSKEVIKQLNSY
jgi:hypothetical protein